MGEAATVNLTHADAENGDSIVAIDESLTTDPQTYSNERICWRKQELQRQLQCHPQSLSVEEMSQVYNVLEQYHGIFSMDEGERGEINHVEFNIDFGESTHIMQVARIVSFAAGQETAAQLSKMQEEGVIQPLNSPWANSVVLVRKWDGSLRFCVDYRALNSVTKQYVFILPWIDDLLDKLFQAKYSPHLI